MVCRRKKKTKPDLVFTLDCADESAALGVLHEHAEVGAPEQGGVAVDVVDGQADGGGGRAADDGVEGEEGADGDAGRARRQGDGQGAAHAQHAEEPEPGRHLLAYSWSGQEETAGRIGSSRTRSS